MEVTPGEPRKLPPGVAIFRGFARATQQETMVAIHAVASVSPFRRMITPSGHLMSVEITNCGAVGWISERSGYRYATTDPLTTKPWPTMPDALRDLAASVASTSGYDRFEPDVCLVNRYRPGDRLGMHRDADEQDYAQPIVSVSLGLSATFMIGGPRRSDPFIKIVLHHGDVVVLGGQARLCYHGIMTLGPGTHPVAGRHRINLTFRRALTATRRSAKNT